MNKKSFKLPCIIFLFHLPIFLVKIDDKKSPILDKKKICINTVRVNDTTLTPEKSINNFSSAHIHKSIKNNRPKKKRKKIQKKKQSIKTKKTQKIIKNRKKLQKALSTSTLGSKKNQNKTSIKKKLEAERKYNARKQEREYNEYLGVISEILGDSLTLPEQGKIKLSLVFDNNGAINKIETLFSESQANLDYLKKNIKKLKFPKFNTQEHRSFTILFDNEK